MSASARTLLVAALALATPASALEFANVSHAPMAFDPTKGETTKIRFRLSEPARVALQVFDGRDLLVRKVAPSESLGSGDHELVWNGRDERGRVVPPEAYVFTLTATARTGQVVEYDLTDLVAAEALPQPVVKWDATEKELHYTLRAPARVNIRAGLANSGPLLRTLIDWASRDAGAHTERWDGKDESGLVDASHNPELQLVAQAWPLPRNAIVVLPERPRVELISKLDWPESHRSRKRTAPVKERALDQQAIERRGDVHLRLSLPEGLARDADGVPVAHGEVAIQLDVDPADRARLIEQRFEAGFYLDGKHMFENEIAFLPMTWVWHAGEVNQGVHYVTGNVWGYAGQCGTATIAIRTEAN